MRCYDCHPNGSSWELLLESGRWMMMMVEDENIQVDKRRCWNAGLAGCVGRWMETMEGHSRLWRLLQKRYTIPPDHPPPMSATNPSPSRPACSVWSDCWSERCTTPGLLGGGWEGQQATFLPSTVTQSQTIFVSVAPLSAAQSTQHLKSRLSPDHSQCVFHSELCSLNFSKTILPFLFGPLIYLSFLVADFCKLRCFFELNTCLYFTPLCTPYFCTLRRPQENLCCLYSQHTFRIRSVPSVLENLEMKICTRYTVIGSDHWLQG